MCRRCFRVVLVVLGTAMLFFAVFPIMAFVQFDGLWQMGLMAAKLVLLPVGAICLLGAAGLNPGDARH